MPKEYYEEKSVRSKSEGDNKLHVHNVAENPGDNLVGATLVGDSTKSTVIQHRRGGGRIVITGDNIKDNYVLQWHGGGNVVVMKDGKDITGNVFDGGFEEEFKHTVGKVVDFFTQPVSKVVGWPSKAVDDDTIILPGKREDYTFKFNNDADKAFAIYTGTVDITHKATSATNRFANYEYITFDGMKNFSKRINLDHFKAEEQAKGAVEKTRSQVTHASETASQQLPSAKEDNLQR